MVRTEILSARCPRLRRACHLKNALRWLRVGTGWKGSSGLTGSLAAEQNLILSVVGIAERNSMRMLKPLPNKSFHPVNILPLPNLLGTRTEVIAVMSNFEDIRIYRHLFERCYGTRQLWSAVSLTKIKARVMRVRKRKGSTAQASSTGQCSTPPSKLLSGRILRLANMNAMTRV